jgi:hypothetical protein
MGSSASVEYQYFECNQYSNYALCVEKEISFISIANVPPQHRAESDFEKLLRHWFGTISVQAIELSCTASPLAHSCRTRPSYNLSPCANASAAGELTIASMRKLSTPASSFFRWKSFVLNTHRLVLRAPPVAILQQFLPSRHLAQVRTEPLSEVWFTPSSPSRSPADVLLGSPGNGMDCKPPDERTLRLGKSE